MGKKKNEPVEPAFEEALNELEGIVKLMEEGNLTLDEALAKFERGVFLSRICSKKLEEAEKKIDILLCTDQGELILKPANLEDRNE